METTPLASYRVYNNHVPYGNLRSSLELLRFKKIKTSSNSDWYGLSYLGLRGYDLWHGAVVGANISELWHRAEVCASISEL